jgi:hypothetical protein
VELLVLADQEAVVELVGVVLDLAQLGKETLEGLQQPTPQTELLVLVEAAVLAVLGALVQQHLLVLVVMVG